MYTYTKGEQPAWSVTQIYQRVSPHSMVCEIKCSFDLTIIYVYVLNAFMN